MLGSIDGLANAPAHGDAVMARGDSLPQRAEVQRVVVIGQRIPRS